MALCHQGLTYGVEVCMLLQPDATYPVLEVDCLMMPGVKNKLHVLGRLAYFAHD